MYFSAAATGSGALAAGGLAAGGFGLGAGLATGWAAAGGSFLSGESEAAAPEAGAFEAASPAAGGAAAASVVPGLAVAGLGELPATGEAFPPSVEPTAAVPAGDGLTVPAPAGASVDDTGDAVPASGDGCAAPCFGAEEEADAGGFVPDPDIRPARPWPLQRKYPKPTANARASSINIYCQACPPSRSCSSSRR